MTPIFPSQSCSLPVVQKLGDRGCLLTGDEIIQVLDADGPKVAYGSEAWGGWQAANERQLRHVGLFEDVLPGQRGGVLRAGKFVEGWYDGS